ncbi:frataxin homolog, mitochondrial [Microplitis mediator]|uniref:frataxin homolog, mitochondrial n=1 Tax=Microplitis mediator TaxID=375433 RepID=UPI002556B26E|nr:frataxin homolog, mitochondrial [Microplitis mediator]
MSALSRGYSALNYKKYLNNYNTEYLSHAPTTTTTTLINFYSDNPSNLSGSELDSVQFEKISDDTLESLTEYFDELIEQATHLDDADVSYGDGVLTVKFGNKYGTYVINRQSPNKQIWLSSPTSGPKRYDFIDGTWIYKHDGKPLHELLDNEIPSIVNNTTSFNDKCSYSRKHIK